MTARRDLDILLPQEPARLEVLSRLRSILRMPRLPARNPAGRAAPEIGPTDLWAAFEYLAGEYETTGCLRDDLADILAAKLTLQIGRARFDLQRRLTAVLANHTSVRFHTALRMAAHLPVPQARTALLQMLTQPGLARWTPTSAAATPGDNGLRPPGHDLRPAVVAALGQLRDPSLLGLFHRLLEKLSAAPARQEKVIAAVQWSLMNLAPGSRGEPVPAMILSVGSRDGQAAQPSPSPVAGSVGDRASTAEALRVVAAFRDRPAVAGSGSTGQVASGGNGQGCGRGESPPGPSERDELLSGF